MGKVMVQRMGEEFGTRPEAWDFVAAYGKEHLLTPPEASLIELIGALY